MSPNKHKIKGNLWETKLVELLNTNIRGASFKRTPGSGALGTVFLEPILTADVVGKIEGFPQAFKVEAKSGYNSSTNKEVKSVSVKKEWLDKVKEEAKGNFSVALLACKFDNSRQGVKYFISMDFYDFCELMNYTTDLKRELDLAYNELQEYKKVKK